MAWFKRSPWVLHYNATSCNGCDIEVIVCLTPLYDLERFGIINTGNPKHADILLVTGSVNEKSKHVLKTLYEQMPDPRVVVAVGICAFSGCVFQDCYNVLGGVDKVMPVDVYVPGCCRAAGSDYRRRNKSVRDSGREIRAAEKHPTTIYKSITNSIGINL